ncbi:MAG: hypothetical protein JNM62_10135 [Flavobacteriales bacterium]|nr:hypothetical protein [Flavobacteriales bacterium]
MNGIHKRVWEGLNNRAYHLGDKVVYCGVQCRVLARYYRQKNEAILYDLRELHGGQVYHRKVDHKEVVAWRG